MQTSCRPMRTASVALGVAAAVLLGTNACDKSNPAKPTPVCSFALSGRDQAFSSAGGPGAVTVETESQCSWSVEGATGWVNLQSPTSVTGPGSGEHTPHRPAKHGGGWPHQGAHDCRHHVHRQPGGPNALRLLDRP